MKNTTTTWADTERLLWLAQANNALQLLSNALDLGASVAPRLRNYDEAIAEVCK